MIGRSLGRRVRSLKLKVLAGITTAMVTLGQTGSSNISNTINSMLPIIMSLFAVLIPLIFIMKIFDVFERLFKNFS